MGSNDGYRDVTKEWLKNANPNSHRVYKRKYYVYDGMKYIVDGKLIVLDHSADEIKTAKWIQKTFGGKIYINPRINYPKGIKTADYLWQNELWDKKGMKGAVSVTRSVHNANNFIIDLSGCILSDEIIIKQIQNLFTSNSKFYIDWLNKIIVVRDDNLIKVIIKNRRRPQPHRARKAF